MYFLMRFALPNHAWIWDFLPHALQTDDKSDGLAIAGPSSVVLNGSAIQRASTTPVQDVNLTILSTEGLVGYSLVRAEEGDDTSATTVVVDCSETPVVENVTSTAFGGVYGAGQRIYFQV